VSAAPQVIRKLEGGVEGKEIQDHASGATGIPVSVSTPMIVLATVLVGSNTTIAPDAVEGTAMVLAPDVNTPCHS
jgi:hypothetical protein